MAIHLKNVTAYGNGRSGFNIRGKAYLENAVAEANGEHGLEVGPTASVSVDGGNFSGNVGHGVFSHAEVIQRARATGFFPSDLADGELYKALKAVHDAPEPEKEQVLSSGPLWSFFAKAKAGLDVAGALASIYSMFHG